MCRVEAAVPRGWVSVEGGPRGMSASTAALARGSVACRCEQAQRTANSARTTSCAAFLCRFLLFTICRGYFRLNQCSMNYQVSQGWSGGHRGGWGGVGSVGGWMKNVVVSYDMQARRGHVGSHPFIDIREPIRLRVLISYLRQQYPMYLNRRSTAVRVAEKAVSIWSRWRITGGLIPGTQVAVDSTPDHLYSGERSP